MIAAEPVLIRTLVRPMESVANRRMKIAELNKQPQTQQWLEVGQALRAPIDGARAAEVTGEWTDHVPTLMGDNQLDPGADELRVVSPLLLRDKQTIADMEGSSVKGTGMAVYMYKPEHRRFLFSLTPMKDATRAEVRLNRISVQISGHEYLLLAGAPITRDEHLWVRYEPDFKPVRPEQAGLIGAASLKAIAPEAIIPSQASGARKMVDSPDVASPAQMNNLM